jgi:hypothetical protein
MDERMSKRAFYTKEKRNYIQETCLTGNMYTRNKERMNMFVYLLNVSMNKVTQERDNMSVLLRLILIRLLQ